jgi:molybdopterin-biosynthesis enzyme MoeA-like protein
MNIGLIIVGDEILSGKRQDKHLAKVIELLAARGLALSWARYAGDDRPRITQDLRDAFAGGDLVFCCGGIGATPDDHTRQCAAAARTWASFRRVRRSCPTLTTRYPASAAATCTSCPASRSWPGR